MSSVRIDRPDLVARTVDALVDRALVVVAPAGYGKTTLVEQALDAASVHPAWVRCTPADRHAGRLLDSIARAVNDAAPGSSEVVADAGGGAHEAPEPTDAVRALLADCDQLLVDPITIVIDDAELLIDAAEACDVVAELIRCTGPKVGVAVLSRRSLPLRLAKPRGGGRLVELGIGELAFDGAECNDLMSEVAGRSVTADEVDGLMAATEGWPLGIATLMQTTGGDQDLGADGPFRTAHALRDYLHEEVIGPLPDQQRRALLASTVPRQLTPAIAEALGLPDDHLAGAGTRGLFLRRLDRESGSFAYHPLFREVLLGQIGDFLTPDELRAVHRSVAPAVALHDPVEAIEHWIAAEEWDRAIDGIAGEASAATSMTPTLVRSWLDRLPDSVRSDPRVQLIEGRVAWAAGQLETAIDHLRAGLDRPDTGVDPVGEWWARFLLIDCLDLVGRPEDAVAIAGGFDAPEAQAAGPISAAAGLYAAHSLAASGRTEMALELASRVRDLPAASAVEPIDALLRAYIDIPAGHLADTADRTLAAYRQVEVDDPLGMRFNLMAAHATALAEQGRRDEALDWWERQRIEADRALLVARVNTIRGLQAMLLAQLGRTADAEDFLALHRETSTWADQSAHVAWALVAAAGGDRAGTLSAVERAMTSAKSAPPVYRWWTAVDVVPALLAVGALESADGALDDAAALVEQTYPGASGRHLRARTTVLRAMLAAEQSDLDLAAALVADGLSEADETAPDVVRSEWPRIGPVVAAALDRGTLHPANTVECLWTAFPDGRALVELAEHPEAAIRISAFRPALGSGHPAARAVVARAVDDEDPVVSEAARAAFARVADAPLPRRFEALGAFRVSRGGWTTDEGSWSRPVDARLVRLLVVHGGNPIPTDLVYDALWPDLDADGARRSLQVAASRVRQILDVSGSTPSIIEANRDTYRLRLAPGDVLDWQQFERAADVALDHATPSLPLLERAYALWGGEPLPEERYSDWAAAWRARLVDRCVDVLVALVDAHSHVSDHASAIRVARELVDLDPYDERSHRLLMTALARAGRRGQALRQYLVCRRMLLDDLDVEPSDATSALHASILAGFPP